MERDWTLLDAWGDALESRGFEVSLVQAVGADDAIIDFYIDIDGPGMHPRRLRTSSLVIGGDRRVSEAALRFPSFDRKRWDDKDVLQAAEDAVAEAGVHPEWSARIAYYNVGYAPHIELGPDPANPPTVSTAIGEVDSIKNAFKRTVGAS